MDLQETLSETIEAYLNGSLGQTELMEFEQKLRTDESLQRTVQRHRDAAVAINYHRNQLVKARLKTIDAELAPVSNPRVRQLSLYRKMAIAASVMILIAAGLHFYAYRNYRPDAIAENLFVSTQHETFRGQNNATSIDEKFSLAEAKFNVREYLQAMQIYQEILNEDTILKDRAEWNLTLCLLAFDADATAFKISLSEILTDENHEYHEEAERLHKTMNGMLYKVVNR